MSAPPDPLRAPEAGRVQSPALVVHLLARASAGVEAWTERGWRSASVLYLLVGILMMWNVWTGFPRAVVGGGEQPDWAGTMWAYWWTGHALLHGLNPFDGTGNFFPVGQRPLAMYNLLDALLAAPFIHLLGPILGFNLFTLFILWSTGMGTHAAARATGVRHGSAMIAGVAVTTSTYLVMELVQGRQSQALLVFWLLGLAGLVRLARGVGDWRTAALTGVATAATFLTYWYAGLFLVLAAVAYWAGHARALVGHPRRLAQGALAAGVTVLLCAPFLYGLIQAYQGLPGVERELDDWMSYGALGRGEFGLSMAIRGSHWPLWPLEYSSTAELADRRIAYGLLAMGLGGLWVTWRTQAGWWLVLLWGYILSLGPYLKGSDGLPKPLALPYLWLYDHLPFFERFWWPDRLDIIVFVALAVLAAVHVELLTQRLAAWRGLVLLGALVLLMGDAPWRNRFLPLMVGKTRPVSAEVYDLIDGPVLTTPVTGGETVRHILWMQVYHGQPTTGGLGEHLAAHRPPGYQDYIDNNTLLAALAALSTTEASGIYTILPRDVQRLMNDGVVWAVIDPWTFGQVGGPVYRAYVQTFYQLWGEPEASSDGVMAWRIKPIMSPIRLQVGTSWSQPTSNNQQPIARQQ